MLEIEMKEKIEQIIRVIDDIIKVLDDKTKRSTNDTDRRLYKSDIIRMNEWKKKVYDVYNAEDLIDRIKDDMLTTYLDMFENTLKNTI